jgi:uncharacterized protein YihD (DUF1040 family)
MRDPERIDRILALLAEHWKANPDLRLGQIVVNAARGVRSWPDVFNVEDEIIERGLRDGASPVVCSLCGYTRDNHNMRHQFKEGP